MRIGRIAAASLLLAGALPAGAQPGQGVRPVRVGLAGPDMDACLSLAEVRGLDRNGDNVLTVRARTSRVAPALDRLGPGRQVWVCDGDAVPGWTGIVYAAEPGQDCNVGSPVPSIRPYAGACRQGWVASRYLTVIAG
ncbi:MAG TPA: hypothetical protein VMG08_19095 [Allosphingosinicella sp.]|nr:hypothetical protein [Allosphingosinicella sp.]